MICNKIVDIHTKEENGSVSCALNIGLVISNINFVA